MDVVKRHFVGAVIPTISGRSSFAVPGGDASGDALGTIVVRPDTGRYRGQHGGWSGYWTCAQIHRGQIEHGDGRVTIADEQSIAIGTHLKAVRTRHWIHAIRAGSTALRTRESAEVVVRAEARDEVESGGCGSAQPGHISSASVTGEIAEYIDNRRNNIHGQGLSCGDDFGDTGSLRCPHRRQRSILESNSPLGPGRYR